jgi:hypothetical protein
MLIHIKTTAAEKCFIGLINGARQQAVKRRHYMDVVTIIVILGMLATVWALLRGIASMVQGGDADFRQSHKLMFQRVGLQALTVLIVILALLTQLK